MKALLRKDFYVLKSALGLYALMIVLFNLCLGASGVILTVLYAAMLPSSAFAYDDKSRWGELSAMLPYAEWEIVCSRYVLGAAGIALFNALGALARLLPAASTPVTMPLAGLCLWLSVLFLDLTMPVYFRFDAEKSRLIRVLILLIFSGAIGAVYAFAGSALLRHETSGAFLLETFRLSWLPLSALSVILTAVSVRLSLWAYRGRKK